MVDDGQIACLLLDEVSQRTKRGCRVLSSSEYCCCRVSCMRSHWCCRVSQSHSQLNRKHISRASRIRTVVTTVVVERSGIMSPCNIPINRGKPRYILSSSSSTAVQQQCSASSLLVGAIVRVSTVITSSSHISSDDFPTSRVSRHRA